MRPETAQTEVGSKNKVGGDSEFNNNPWVQIFRAKSRDMGLKSDLLG
jgi:hypothetical protein